MNVEIRIAKEELRRVKFNDLKIGQAVTGKHGWTRVKISSEYYLCMKENESVQVHEEVSFPSDLSLMASVRYVKLIVEEI